MLGHAGIGAMTISCVEQVSCNGGHNSGAGCSIDSLLGQCNGYNEGAGRCGTSLRCQDRTRASARALRGQCRLVTLRSRWPIYELVQNGQAALCSLASLSGSRPGSWQAAVVFRWAEQAGLIRHFRAPPRSLGLVEVDGRITSRANTGAARRTGAGAAALTWAGARRRAPMARTGALVPDCLQRAPMRLWLFAPFKKQPRLLRELVCTILRSLAGCAAGGAPVTRAATPRPTRAHVHRDVNASYGGNEGARLLAVEEVANLGELGRELIVRRQLAQHPRQVERQLATDAAELPPLPGKREAQHAGMEKNPRAELPIAQQLRTRQVLVVADEAADRQPQAPRELAQVHADLVQAACEDTHTQEGVAPGGAPGRRACSRRRTPTGAAAERSDSLVARPCRLAVALGDLGGAVARVEAVL
mmetsp:Transcript_133840/g.373171  ORF Transcript_133840/g.373171 Transcript_133840/m.373171 type:complete len:417 (-) Transcript_133840:470-1720(-)